MLSSLLPEGRRFVDFRKKSVLSSPDMYPLSVNESMNSRRILMIMLGTLWLFVGPARGRQWTSSDGRFQVEATLIGFDGLVIRIQKADGNQIELPVNRLLRAHVYRVVDVRPRGGARDFVLIPFPMDDIRPMLADDNF